jgi:hypothetical protein
LPAGCRTGFVTNPRRASGSDAFVLAEPDDAPDFGVEEGGDACELVGPDAAPEVGSDGCRASSWATSSVADFV